MKYIVLSCLFISLFIISCSKNEQSNNAIQEELEYSTLIDPNNIFGTLDPWPLIEHPNYKSVNEFSGLNDSDRVLLYKATDRVYAYAVRIMDVEILNDIIDDIPLAITYCPKTRSGICWDRVIASDTLDFAVSGQLYLENQMPYDHASRTVWSQMLLFAIKGQYKDERINVFTLIETNWKNVKEYFPDAMVYFNRFGLENQSQLKAEEFPEGEEMFGIIGRNQTILFRYEMFDDDEINIYFENIVAGQAIIIGSKSKHFITAYKNKYTMLAVQNEFPIVLMDETGSKWTVFGEAVSGPRMGEKLESTDSYVALGWAWKDMFDNVVMFTKPL